MTDSLYTGNPKTRNVDSICRLITFMCIRGFLKNNCHSCVGRGYFDFKIYRSSTEVIFAISPRNIPIPRFQLAGQPAVSSIPLKYPRINYTNINRSRTRRVHPTELPSSSALVKTRLRYPICPRPHSRIPAITRGKRILITNWGEIATKVVDSCITHTSSFLVS